MCGISALISTTYEKDELTKIINSMNDKIKHRGPDGSGTFISDRNEVAFGHRRLAIIDLDKRSDQPMVRDDLVIVFNGEIYNYIELKEELKELGCSFNTDSDTEVILAAYQKWGVDSFQKFNGMWALCIYDIPNNRLIVSRDRWGIKPLYYGAIEGSFYFFSEIKQVAEIFPMQINKEVLAEYLFSGYVESSDETFIDAIKKVKASTYMVMDLASKEITEKKYYDLKICEEDDACFSKESDIEKSIGFFDTLLSSVKLRLRSDVKSATCLSGGIDSSVIASLSSRLYGDNFTAITAKSSDRLNDESHYAKIVADKNNLDWKVIEPNVVNLRNELHDLVHSQEEPFNGLSLYMQYKVQEIAGKNKIKVLLDGQGGDEILLGYQKYFIPILIEIYRSQGLLSMIKEARLIVRENKNINTVTLITYLVGIFFPSTRRLYDLSKIPNVKARYKHLYKARVARDFSRHAKKSVKELQKREMTVTNLPALLRHEDKNSMRFSVEARLPFLDYRVVEYAINLPLRFKYRGGVSKLMLKESVFIPKEIASRKEKIGFAAPVAQWGEVIDELADIYCPRSLILLEIFSRPISSFYQSLDMDIKWRVLNIALWEELYDVKI
ncbi:asparagine synthase (glutamine-hydrolyzing) [Shewanella sp.]|uniref:asparagine synthase (glutamine-hydrolyzing) n=1 Tax=Shewanella sp. TaxID=50422 RepID=UPI0040479755